MAKTHAPMNVYEWHGGLRVEDPLSERLLGRLLRDKYGDDKVLAQYVIPETRFRVDYFVNVGSPMAVEFDGPGHYTSAQQVARDKLKDRLLGELNIQVIRIPPWLQLDLHTAEVLGLSEKLYVETTFPHGWVTDKVYPASYCEAGFDRFVGEIQWLIDNAEHAIVRTVLNSLLVKEAELKEVVLTARQLAVVQALADQVR